jgi:hypothetical protein
MSYYPKDKYKLIGFKISDRLDKKYYAILQNRKTKEFNKVYFGAIKKNGIPYDQYFDKLGYYKKYNHGDILRRSRYRKRHKNDINKPYSSSWFSLMYLW